MAGLGLVADYGTDSDSTSEPEDNVMWVDSKLNIQMNLEI